MSYPTSALLFSKYQEWRHNAPSLSGFSAQPISVSRSAGDGGGSFVGLIMNVWKCTITSEPNSIWSQGNFNVELRFPQQFNGQFSIYFKPSILHPNVSRLTGLVYCSVIPEKAGKWTEVGIKDILLGLRHLLDHPKLIEGTQNEYAARMYWRNYQKYARWVKLDIAENHSNAINV